MPIVWWEWLVSVMTGEHHHFRHQCHLPEKMTTRMGAEGGCGTEKRPCRPKNPAKRAKDGSGNDSVSPGVDFFAQATKALVQRSPLDVPEDGNVSGLSVPTLPSNLASLLKQTDNRKRHKKSHSSDHKKKKSSRQGERSKAGSIWVETEEYFRNLGLPDIEALSELSSFRSLASRKCFWIPVVGSNVVAGGERNTGVGVSCVKSEDGITGNDVAGGEEIKNVVKEEVKDVVVKEEVKEEVMEVDNVGAESCLPEEENVCSVSDFSTSFGWVLGSRNRILLTSERPSKKRKLLGCDAGLEKLVVACPCEGNSSLCDFCCTGATGKDSSRFVVCSSCRITVHRKCYGVYEDVDKSWLCSWCRQRNGRSNIDRPCVLCPKPGGALKPVRRSLENNGPVEFAHLFCAQWMPEVYVEDSTKMEPIVNLEGIKETRKKLVCNLCKVKYGACVRCSNGTCRTSFHPICAREAGNRLEVWGKYGCDTIELRGFCSKHSNIQENGRHTQAENRPAAVSDNTSVGVRLPTRSSKRGCRNGDKMAVDVGTPSTSSDISGNSEFREIESPHSKLNGPVLDSGEAQNMNLGVLVRKNFEEVNLSESLSFVLILKKLIDRGKVDVKDVAAEIDINPDALSAKLKDGNLLPDLRCKIVKWLGKHAYMGTWLKGSKIKVKPAVASKPEAGMGPCTEHVEMQESDISEPATVMSFPRRNNDNNSKSLKEEDLICPNAETTCDNGVVVNEGNADQPIREDVESSSKASVPCGSEKSSGGPDNWQNCSEKLLTELEGDLAKPVNCTLTEGGESEVSASPAWNTLQDLEFPICLDLNPALSGLLDREALSGFYVHPHISKELSQMQRGMFLKNKMLFDGEGTSSNFDGSEGEISYLQASSSASVCCKHHNQQLGSNDTLSDGQLSKARDLDVLELSPEDEVEGELIYYQHRLLGNAVSRKKLSDNLTCKVAKKLPLEIDAQRQQTWDDVLVNKYFCELREARKQGRKEKRHKEAQAVLAAATAAAAASSRISSLRKETSEECSSQENLLKTSISHGRVGSGSHLMPRAKETLSKMAISRTPSEKQSDYLPIVSEFSRENPRSCDICRRSETIWNLILVCSSCKVAVHLDCYRCLKESTGPWYCELCEELSSSKLSGAPSVNFWDKPFSAAECSLCGGTTGAFRKTTNGQWVHAFCAEWVMESTFRRGQVDPVRGMETVPKGMDICCVCRRKHGACIKCNYGNCQTTFHPSCARSAGFYMTGSGRLPHKAYCEKHSLEQKAKAETQKHGAEELKYLKQYRVELERLRLLCERIVKREKIKRELVLCSQEILAFKRDQVARSLLVRSPFFPPDVSSESATTSLKGTSNKSGSEAIQRSDDVTIDSTLSVKRRSKVPVTMDADQKTDDSATSQSHFTRKPNERARFSGKTIPRRHTIVSTSNSEDGEKSTKSRNHIETFAKELVMTSDEASIKNQRLPKGYFYVPVDRLQEEKLVNQDGNGKLSERDG